MAWHGITKIEVWTGKVQRMCRCLFLRVLVVLPVLVLVLALFLVSGKVAE